MLLKTFNLQESKCIDELQAKAGLYEETGLVPVFDYSACVVKSDTILDSELTQKLIDAVKPLENVPGDAQDWHPGSDGKVLDLVHPSMWPLVFGRTHILPDREIGLDDCLQAIGTGEVIPHPSGTEPQKASGFWDTFNRDNFSFNFQWLPCNVEIGPDGRASVKSYINNLHPVTHKHVYPVIEDFITKSLPAWDLVYRWPRQLHFQRLQTMTAHVDCQTPDICDRYSCAPHCRPLSDDEAPRDEDEVYHEGYEESERGQLDLLWFYANHPMLGLPGAQHLDFTLPKVRGSDVRTESFFDGKKNIQVIVKLANIHLNPWNPTYDGGSWHIEGEANEHICATALYYYDNENITESKLSFRTSCNREDLCMELGVEQNDMRSIARTFAVEESHGASTLQDVGAVLTRPGRAVFFPNLFLHKVEPFELKDKTKPGHRKILAMFLVDPAVPIISTANCPPQQRHWWDGEHQVRHGMRLPPEVGEMVLQNVDFPYDEAEARRVRERLMEERKMVQGDFVNTLSGIEFNFCEH